MTPRTTSPNAALVDRRTSTNSSKSPPGKYRWVRIFLATLSQNGSVTLAAEKAGINALAAYRHKSRSATFARYWEYSLEKAADDLEAEIYRRAKEGIEKVIWYQGEQRGTENVVSDSLAMFWLKGRRPNKYRETAANKPTESGNPGAISEAAREKLLERRRKALGENKS